MFLSNIIFYPIACALDKVFPAETKLDCAALQDKIGIFGENHVIGFILGTVIGLIAGQGEQAFATGVMAATALTLFPMVSKLFMTALTPISEAASAWVQKRFPGRQMVVGLDWPILAGNSEIWVAIILTIPVASPFPSCFPATPFCLRQPYERLRLRRCFRFLQGRPAQDDRHLLAHGSHPVLVCF